MTSCNRYYQSPKSRCQRKLLYYGADLACKLSSNNLSEKDKGERLFEGCAYFLFFFFTSKIAFSLFYPGENSRFF